MKNSPHIVLIDDDLDLLELLRRVFRQKGYQIQTFGNAEEALIEMEKGKASPHVVVCDLKLPVMSGVEFVKRVKRNHSNIPVILMTSEGKLETAIEAIEAGAYDFVLKPLHIPQLLISVQRALHLQNLQQENKNLKSIFGQQEFLANSGVVARSSSFRRALELAQQVANSKASVLITGESGTGKEVIAKAIHNFKTDNEGPMLSINCSAIPEQLLESELFGHVKGAFTGAVEDRIGLFEEAKGGTVFLDEIGDLPLTLQAKLLRVIQERKVKRVGENKERDISARIISATHRDLKKEIAEARFREDLYFRLNVIPIHLLPLRERTEDILPLAENFLKKFCVIDRVSPKKFSRDAISKIESLQWKGNVRELENAIERAVVLSTSDTIEVSDLPQEETGMIETQNKSYFQVDRLMRLDELNLKYIQFAFNLCGGTKEKVAQELGIDRKTLYRKLKDISLQ